MPIREMSYSEFVALVADGNIAEPATIDEGLRHYGVLRETFLSDVKGRNPRAYARLEGLSTRPYNFNLSTR